MDAQAPITAARQQLSDEYSVHFNDTALIKYVNEAQREILKRRPELRMDGDGALTAVADVDELSDALGVDEDFSGAITDYVVARALLESQVDTENNRKAALHLQHFYRVLSHG